MAIPFPSEEWIHALMIEINKSDAYRQAAKNWEGDFFFRVAPGPGVEDGMDLYMDLWHGECRAAFAVQDPSERQPEFMMEAPLPVWRKVIEKSLDPIQGLLTRQLKLKGNMLKIMKAPKAATELVECCTKVDTEWPA